MTVPQSVVDLVERFERNRAAYHAGQYNEAQTRQEFIAPSSRRRVGTCGTSRATPKRTRT